MKIAVTIIHILITVVLTVSVLLQQGKDAGLSGALGGTNNESFFGKNKSRTLDGLLGRITAISAVLFIITSLVLAFVFR